MAGKIARQLDADASATKSLLDDMQSNHALGRLAPIIPQLPQPAVHALLAFDSVQRLVAEDPALSNEFLSKVLKSDAPVASKGFIRYLPHKRAADLLSRTCSDLLVAFELIGPLNLPVDVEDAILSDFEPRLPDTPAADAPEELQRVPTGTEDPATAAAAVPAQGIVANPPTARPHPSLAELQPRIPDAPAAHGWEKPQEHPISVEAPATAAAAVPAQVTNPSSPTAQPRTSQLPKSAPTRSPRVLSGPSSRAVPAPEVGTVARPDEAVASSRPKRQTTTQQKPAWATSDSEDDALSSSGDESSDAYVPPPPPDDAVPADAPGASVARRQSPVPAPEPAASSSGAVPEGSSIYGNAGIPSPDEHRQRWESKMDAAMWDLVHDSSIPFQDEDSEPEKWPRVLEKYRAKHSDQAELPPVLDDESRRQREDQWGERHDDIVAFEKQQFLALPSVIRKCAGRANGSRNNGDIYLRRFWAPYLMVNVCILDDKESLTRANAEIIEYTFRRFSHLADPNSTTEGQASAAYKTPIRSCLSTFKHRVGRTFTAIPTEPKVKKRQMERALSFVAGELRRSGVPNLWAATEGQNAVNEQVANRMAAFAEEFRLDISHPDVQAQRLGFRSTASAVLFRQQSEEVRRKYEGKAQDPSMSSADFADASAPMLRSFADALADETDGVALVAYALRTSQGPLVVVSQHGEKLKDRSWLQSKGTDFLKPFFEIASSVFELDEGQLGVVAAQPAVPAETIHHPWTKAKASLLSAPKFQVPVTEENEKYNAKILRQAILDAIRTYSGESPTFAMLRTSVDKYIVAKTTPTFLIDPIHMSPEMLAAWVNHWLQSADPDSDLPPENRLRFTGQALYEEAPLLHNTEIDDPDADDEMYEPPRQVKPSAKKTLASSSKGASKPRAPAKPKGKGKEKEGQSAQFQGKGKGKEKEKEVQSAQAPQRRSRSTREVFVEVPAVKRPSTRGNAQQPQAPQHPSPAAKPAEDRAVMPHPPALPTEWPLVVAGWPLDDAEPSAAGPSGPRGGTPTPAASRTFFAPQQTNHSDQDAPRSPQTSVPRIPSPIPMQIDGPEDFPAPQATPPFATPVPTGPVALVQYSSHHESSFQLPAHPAARSRADPPTETSLPGGSPNVAPEDDRADGPDDSDVPNRPPTYKRPHAIPMEVRVARKAQVGFKVQVNYEFKDAVTAPEISQKVALWAQDTRRRVSDLGRFMKEVTAAGIWAIQHSTQSAPTLAPLMQAAAVLQWYTVCKSYPAKQTPRPARLQLAFPWNNVAVNTPPHRLYQTLTTVSDSVPLLSFLVGRDGGWSPANLAIFGRGLLRSVHLAVAGAIWRTDDIPVAWIDPIPVGRALVLLRQSRSLLKTHPQEYDGPGEDLTNAITDRTVLIFNGIAVVRFLYHSVYGAVMQAGAAFSSTSARGLLWQRYSECMLCVIDSIALALKAGRSDFFSFTLLSSLPTTLHALAQTINAQTAWWYRFSDGPSPKPKALAFGSKSNVYANKITDWAGAITEEGWLSFTGFDRAVVAVMASIALLQPLQVPDLDERKTWDSCASVLLHLQVIATRCRLDRLESEGGPILPVLPVPTANETQWPAEHPWVARPNSDAADFSQPLTDDECPGLVRSVNIAAAEKLLQQHTGGSIRLLSPKKKAVRSAGKGRLSPSPSPSPVAPNPPSPPLFGATAFPPDVHNVSADAESTPGRPTPRVEVSAVQRAVSPEPAPLARPSPPTSTSQQPELPVPPSSPLSEPPPADEVDDEAEEEQLPTEPELKRKRAASQTSNSSKRTRTDRQQANSDQEDAEPVLRRSTRPRHKKSAPA